MGTCINLAGQKFNRLTVVERAGNDNTGKNARWLCVCDCGNRVVITGPNLKSGTTQSCGCLRKETTSAVSVTHGKSYTPEYKSWECMIQRCNNSRRHAYQYYGERGIAVCEQWRKSFQAFYADMGDKPSPQHSIDRIDVDGNYEPDNCRWATRIEQAQNKRPHMVNA